MAYIVNASYHQLIGIEGPIPFRKYINSIGQLYYSNDTQQRSKKILTVFFLSSPHMAEDAGGELKKNTVPNFL